MDHRTNDRRSMLMFITSMLIFGTIGIFRRFMPFSSAFLAFTRGILGGLFLLIYITLKGKNKKEKPAVRTIVLLTVSGAVMGINWMLLFEAYHYTTVGIATLCYYMQPTIVVLLSPFLFSEKLTWKKTLCAAVSILGMMLVSGVIGASGSQNVNPQGVLLGLGAAVCYSAVVILNKKISGVDAYQKTMIQLLSAGTVMIPYLFRTAESGENSFTFISVLLLLVVGLVHTGIAYVLYFGSMDGLKAQSVAIFSYIDPVSALLFSAILLQEPLNISGIIGAILIIGSAIISEISIQPKNV